MNFLIFSNPCNFFYFLAFLHILYRTTDIPHYYCLFATNITICIIHFTSLHISQLLFFYGLQYKSARQNVDHLTVSNHIYIPGILT